MLAISLAAQGAADEVVHVIELQTGLNRGRVEGPARCAGDLGADAIAGQHDDSGAGHARFSSLPWSARF